MITNNRKLESIVPSEHRKTFSLYMEEEPINFNLSAAPKKQEAAQPMDAPSPDAPPMDAPPVEPAQDSQPAGKDDESSWLVKKLVGILRYAGSMGSSVRGALPDQALEIIDKLEKELEALASALEPFSQNQSESEGPEESTDAEEPVPEGGESTSEPAPETQEPQAEQPTKPAFKAKRN